MPPPPLFFSFLFSCPRVSMERLQVMVVCGSCVGSTQFFLSVLEYVCVCMPHFCICLM